MPSAFVITVSDRSSRGERADLSGPAVCDALRELGLEISGTSIVPDEVDQLSRAIIEACGKANLVVTTGGTGIALRDVTPEATRAVCDRIIDGLGERMRAEGALHTPFAWLSRAVCGTRGRVLIVNLPGSPKGAVQSLKSIGTLIPHALELLAGRTEHNADVQHHRSESEHER